MGPGVCCCHTSKLCSDFAWSLFGSYFWLYNLGIEYASWTECSQADVKRQTLKYHINHLCHWEMVDVAKNPFFSASSEVHAFLTLTVATLKKKKNPDWIIPQIKTGFLQHRFSLISIFVTILISGELRSFVGRIVLDSMWLCSQGSRAQSWIFSVFSYNYDLFAGTEFYNSCTNNSLW